MKKLLVLIMCCMLIVLLGCATKYKAAKKATKYGYFDNGVQDNVFDVQFKANSYSKGVVIYDYVMLRCCEVCLENGYDSFNILSESNYSSSTNYVATNVYGKNIYSYPVTQYYPYYLFRIECFNDNEGSFKAEQVRNNLIKKNNLKKLKTKYNL